MALILVILALLILAAMIYGVFFLIFKLGWVIAGKKANKWPLILAGASTVLLFGVFILGIMLGVNKYFAPVKNVVEHTFEKTQITTGIRPYTNPQYGFTINLFGGTELGEPIRHSSKNQFILGFDTNFGPLMRQQKQKPVEKRTLPPMSALVLIINQKAPVADTQKELAKMAQAFQKSGEGSYTVTTPPDYSIPNMVFMEGQGSTSDGLPFMLFAALAIQGDKQYSLFAPANGSKAYLQAIRDQVRSFRPEGMPPAPLPYQASFTVPQRENMPALPQTAN